MNIDDDGIAKYPLDLTLLIGITEAPCQRTYPIPFVSACTQSLEVVAAFLGCVFSDVTRRTAQGFAAKNNTTYEQTQECDT